MPLPYGYVEGRFVAPDTATPAVGEVRFALLVARGETESTPLTRAVPRRVVGTLVDGVLAPTRLAAGRYAVTFALIGVALPRFVIDVSPAHTEEAPLDLLLAAPLQPSPHERFVVNELVHREALAAADSAATSAASASADRDSARAYQASAWNARNEAEAARQDVRARTLTATPDPDRPDVLILTFPSYMLHADGSSLLLPMEATQ